MLVLGAGVGAIESYGDAGYVRKSSMFANLAARLTCECA
jgi:hypothetical protein